MAHFAHGTNLNRIIDIDSYNEIFGENSLDKSNQAFIDIKKYENLPIEKYLSVDDEIKKQEANQKYANEVTNYLQIKLKDLKALDIQFIDNNLNTNLFTWINENDQKIVNFVDYLYIRDDTNATNLFTYPFWKIQDGENNIKFNKNNFITLQKNNNIQTIIFTPNENEQNEFVQDKRLVVSNLLEYNSSYKYDIEYEYSIGEVLFNKEQNLEKTYGQFCIVGIGDDFIVKEVLSDEAWKHYFYDPETESDLSVKIIVADEEKQFKFQSEYKNEIKYIALYTNFAYNYKQDRTFFPNRQIKFQFTNFKINKGEE